jgi:hypothetical protein
MVTIVSFRFDGLESSPSACCYAAVARAVTQSTLKRISLVK